MKITILENKVGSQNIQLIKSGMAEVSQLLHNIGLNIDVFYKTTDLTLSSMALNTDVVHGFGINPQPILDSVDGTDDIACMIYNWNGIIPQPTNPCTSGIKKGKTIPMQIPEQWSGVPFQVETFIIFFLHELCHAVYILTNTSPDLTHSFYSSPFAQTSNRPLVNYYLSLLTNLISAWNKYSNILPYLPVVTLTRKTDDGKETLGELRSNNNSFGCFTLERPWVNNKQNISCIPKGKYTCKYTFSIGRLGWTYEVLNVPGRTGIRIHKGNYVFDSLGCIMLGGTIEDINKDGIKDITNTATIVPSFEKAMNKQPFTLLIQ